MNGEQQPPNIGAHIQAAITAGHTLKQSPGVDKKWLNKTIARLEEAQVFCAKAEGYEFAAAQSACTCPAGVRSSACPVHGFGVVL